MAGEFEQAFDLMLMSNFVHQVVNPMNAVCGTLDNIISGDVPPGAVSQRIKAARAQLEVCVELVRNLAFFAEFLRDPEGYRQRHTGKRSVVPDVVIQAALFFQEPARKKRMKIHLVDRDTQYKVDADKDLLRQVFINLFDNAVKYGQDGTDILVKCRLQRRTNDLLIEVINTSPPVPRENWEKIFEPGFRGQNALQTIASGTGLGLYICRQIMSVYHGTIEYRSRADNESVFIMRIPGGSV
jgi:signal transduction histidine kinase